MEDPQITLTEPGEEEVTRSKNPVQIDLPPADGVIPLITEGVTPIQQVDYTGLAQAVVTGQPQEKAVADWPDGRESDRAGSPNSATSSCTWLSAGFVDSQLDEIQGTMFLQPPIVIQ